MRKKDVDGLIKAIAGGAAAVRRVERAFAIAATYGPRMRVNAHGYVQTYSLAVYQRMIEEAWLGNGSRIESQAGELRILGPDGERVDWATFERVWDAASTSMALLPTVIDYIAEVQRRHPELADVVADTQRVTRLRHLMRGDEPVAPPLVERDEE